MKPGRELDALIAEKVMSLEVFWLLDIERGGKHPYFKDGKDIYGLDKRTGVDNYSTNIAAAWEVVEKLKDQFWIKLENNNVPGDSQWCCDVDSRDENGRQSIEYADTAPHAICLAALKTVT